MLEKIGEQNLLTFNSISDLSFESNLCKSSQAEIWVWSSSMNSSIRWYDLYVLESIVAISLKRLTLPNASSFFTRNCPFLRSDKKKVGIRGCTGDYFANKGQDDKN